MQKWKRLGSKKLFEHPRLTVFEDEVELPSGLQTKYLHFASAPGTGMVIARNNDGKFLIQKEYSYPPNEFLYQFPGGALHENEDPAIGAARELAEESGYFGTLCPLGWFYPNNRRTSQKMSVFLAVDLQETAKQPDPEESIENYWFTEQEIDAMIQTNEICNYTLLAGWALYKAHPELH